VLDDVFSFFWHGFFVRLFGQDFRDYVIAVNSHRCAIGVYGVWKQCMYGL